MKGECVLGLLAINWRREKWKGEWRDLDVHWIGNELHVLFMILETDHLMAWALFQFSCVLLFCCECSLNPGVSGENAAWMGDGWEATWFVELWILLLLYDNLLQSLTQYSQGQWTAFISTPNDPFCAVMHNEGGPFQICAHGRLHVREVALFDLRESSEEGCGRCEGKDGFEWDQSCKGVVCLLVTRFSNNRAYDERDVWIGCKNEKEWIGTTFEIWGGNWDMKR